MLAAALHEPVDVLVTDNRDGFPDSVVQDRLDVHTPDEFLCWVADTHATLVRPVLLQQLDHYRKNAIVTGGRSEGYNAYHLAEGIRTATERAGVKFVDMRLPFEGHEACSAEPSINGVDAAHISEIFHPNQYGHAVVYTFMLHMETDVY